ncbi:CG33189, partial [Drosophila busckii]
DVFYDCLGDESEQRQAAGGGDASGSCQHYRRQCNYSDPAHIRATLQRAANATQRLLRDFGGPCAALHTEQHFYPATLEINARLHTNKELCAAPARQCRLRGDPVTLKLPMSFDMQTGQLKVNIFQ